MNNTHINTIQTSYQTTPHLQNPQAASWMEISRDAFTHNVHMYRKILDHNAQLFIVGKANAYGHGVETIAQLAQAQVAVDGMCVATLSEALLLRKRDFTKKLLVFGHIDASLEDAIAQEIHISVFTLDFIKKLNTIAQKLNKKAIVHIKVDTGLSRLGFYPEEALRMIKLITEQMPFIHIYGVFSHFAESDAQDMTFTNEQITRFQWLVDEINKLSLHPLALHLCNSTGIIRIPQAHYTLARTGGGIWGIAKSDRIKAEVRKRFPDFHLKPILTWKTRLMSIKQVPAGNAVSYACTYTTERDSVLGIIPIGYFDGYPRPLSNKGVVLVDGKVAPIRGRVAMNMIIIDLTDIPSASSDSVITVIGNHPLINPEYLAQQIGTISYEILVGLHPSIERVIVQ